jgi:hypothetical protein
MMLHPISTQDQDFDARLTVHAFHIDQRNNYTSSLSLNQLETDYLPTTVTPSVPIAIVLDCVYVCAGCR